MAHRQRDNGLGFPRRIEEFVGVVRAAHASAIAIAPKSPPTKTSRITKPTCIRVAESAGHRFEPNTDGITLATSIKRWPPPSTRSRLHKHLPIQGETDQSDAGAGPARPRDHRELLRTSGGVHWARKPPMTRCSPQ
jgi:hypothetical protein